MIRELEIAVYACREVQETHGNDMNEKQMAIKKMSHALEKVLSCLLDEQVNAQEIE